ncbi:response regulator [bacterium]|nr:response regulator [bacterium]
MTDRALERIKVLVVDDNHHMINIVKTILRGFGIKQFVDARDAVEAFDRFRSEVVDLIVCDHAMPILDGTEFVRMVRSADDSTNPFVPIIMLTAYSEKSKVEAARDAGVNEFCVKPVTAVDMYRKLSSIINSPRAFVRSREYFGPDRRRHNPAGFKGEERRESTGFSKNMVPVNEVMKAGG